jgi:hypothetical protein
MPVQTKTSRPINSKLEKKLAAYIAAASAAGVSILAAAPPANAEVVFTPAHKTVNGLTAIDLNHDGINDFAFELTNVSHLFGLVAIPQVTGNAVEARAGFSSVAAAGFFGVPIGAGEKFITSNFYGLPGVLMAGGYAYGNYATYFGPWINANNRYLGVKFVSQGQVHFGWVRMTVGPKINPILITGYAYETIPGKTIIEGHTSGPEKATYSTPANLAPSSQPATLGLLASGAPGLEAWRRKNEAIEALEQ